MVQDVWDSQIASCTTFYVAPRLVIKFNTNTSANITIAIYNNESMSMKHQIIDNKRIRVQVCDLYQVMVNHFMFVHHYFEA